MDRSRMLLMIHKKVMQLRKELEVLRLESSKETDRNYVYTVGEITGEMTALLNLGNEILKGRD